MFGYCDSLTSIDLSNFDTQKLLYAEDVFSGSYNLRYIDISSFYSELDDYSYLLENISSYGTLKINEYIYDFIKEYIPSNWTIIIKK